MNETSSNNIIKVSIEEEFKTAYLEYAMSVIVGRALPDVRDGFKPVHKRVLFAMHELKNTANSPYKKSARIVGDVIGKYHPHGDSAVYDTIVRMAQEFSLRYPLVDGQGNFGSIDGDAPAAMRYTEIRLTKLAQEILEDLDKDTVDFVDNYDNSEKLPTVLPSKVPNLLINGSAGIAVGMATNIPPHNLTEVINGALALIDNPDIEIDGLIAHISGPDFPTYAIINGRAGIISAYRTGRGKIYVRSRYHIEPFSKDREALIITEIPYQINKARLIEKIANLVRAKEITAISDLRDESNKKGLRIVIELKRNENAEVVMNNLFKSTELQTTFGINIVVLDGGKPIVANLKMLLESFIRHRREIVTRRTEFELRKARDRGHILEGLTIALHNIDKMIEYIRTAANTQDARIALMSQPWPAGLVAQMLEKSDASVTKPLQIEKHFGLQADGYHLSDKQSQAILDMRLQKLTGLEQQKLVDEYHKIVATIHELLEILNSPQRVMEVIREELESIQERFGDERRTEIIESKQDLEVLDLITDETMMITLTRTGYVKAQVLSEYRAQNRGGKGKSATGIKDEDQILHVLSASTHDVVLCFSNFGKVYWLAVYAIPRGSRSARGRPLINMIDLSEHEQITSIIPLEKRHLAKDEDKYANAYLLMVTKQGTIKRTEMGLFSRPRNSGLIAIALDEGDQLANVAITNGDNGVMLFSDAGKAIRFHETQLRPLSRIARGVRGIRLKKRAAMIAMIIADANATIITASENGYGKRTKISEFQLQKRGGQGVKAIGSSSRNGSLIAVRQVTDENDIVLISNQGTLVRIRADEIRLLSRAALGVKLINLAKQETLIGIDIVDRETEAAAVLTATMPADTTTPPSASY